jgi:hypothetical protein
VTYGVANTDRALSKRQTRARVNIGRAVRAWREKLEVSSVAFWLGQFIVDGVMPVCKVMQRIGTGNIPGHQYCQDLAWNWPCKFILKQ